MQNVNSRAKICVFTLFCLVAFAHGSSSCFAQTISTQVTTGSVPPGITVIPISLKLQGLPSTSVVDVNFWKVTGYDQNGGPIRAVTATATTSLSATYAWVMPGFPQYGTYFIGFTGNSSLITGTGPYVVSFTNGGAEVAWTLVSP